MTISADNMTPAARQVIMATRQLNSLATLPGTVSRLLGILKNSGLTPTVTDIIKADPSLTALFLSLNNHNGLGSKSLAIEDKLGPLSASEIQSMILSVPAYFEEILPEIDSSSKLPYCQLVLHCVETACAAKLIADIVLDQSQRQLAYMAGLLHDIGKLALNKIMPRSFQRIVESAHLNHLAFHLAEFEHIDIDHTIIGKRLAEKWHLPEPIMYAIWLHHTDTESIVQDSSDYRFVRVIRLADIIARQSGSAVCGSFDSAVIPDGLLDSLGMSLSDVESVRATLGEAIAEKTELLGINDAGAADELGELLQDTASSLAAQNASLHEKNRNLMLSSLHIEFVQQLFTDLDSLSTPIDVATSCARLWQTHYQSGAVCLYFIADQNDTTIEMVTLDRSGKVSTFLPSIKGDNPIFPVQIQNNFDVIDAYDASSWILSQIDLELDISKTRMVPLLNHRGIIGALIFEHGFVEASKQRQLTLFETSATAIAASLGQSIALQKNSFLAERFVTALGSASRSNDRIIKLRTFEGIAEMAAGAGHELNNPLAVISGKTQMLAASETDLEKKKTLENIQARTEEMSRIVSQMMAFAKPGTPNTSSFSLVKIINAAAELVAVANRLDALQITLAGIEAETMVNVDPDQMAAALTAILSNCLDAYGKGDGPIEVSASCPQKQGYVSFLIRDSGGGMDAETLAKAMVPFFSAKPAGRKRGMGLTNAERLIGINGGAVKVTSILGKGTTVRIELPI